MNEEHTIALKKLGKVKTVKVYNQAYVDKQEKQIEELEKKNKELKEILIVGTTWNKGLISRNKALEEESDKYRNIVFDKMEQIDRAKDIIEKLVEGIRITYEHKGFITDVDDFLSEAEQFLKEADK